MNENPRKLISKRIRFEVFKRDSFKCQYCGESAPDVILHVDHIEPVAAGGQSDITNLVTSCLDCNLGKGARKISDQSAIKRAKSQLDSLQDRKEQLEMVVEWQRGLMNLDKQAVDQAAKIWDDLVRPSHLTQFGRDSLRKYIKRFGLREVLQAFPLAVAGYLKTDSDGNHNPESIELAWRKVPGICYVQRKLKDKPYLKDLYSIRSTLNYRLRGYFDTNGALRILEDAVLSGVSIAHIRENLADIKNWTEFREMMQALVAEQKQLDGGGD